MQALRVSLHVIFAFLLGFAMVQSVVAGTHVAAVLALSCALAALYVAGTVLENRRQGRHLPTPMRWSLPWLGCVVALWIALMALSTSFVWLLFPLIFLTLHLVPTRFSLPLVGALWAIAAFLPLLSDTTWSLAEAVGPAIGTVFAIGVYFTYRSLGREVTRQAVLAQKLLDAQEELVLSEHLAGRMEERERLSREIHDTVAQGLSSISLLARAARNNLAAGNTEEARTQLEAVSEQASSSLAEARRFVYDLRSPDLETSLPAALKSIAGRIESRQEALGEPLTVEVNCEEAHLPEPISRLILRVSQEALSNVAKHARATRAVLTLSVWDDELCLDIVDNGQGFDPDDHHAGFGLTGIRERVSEAGGAVEISSSESGTAVACRIPLAAQ